MDAKQLRKIARNVMVRDLASRTNDPRFYAGLTVLPNPDPVLRQMGQADRVYDAIMSDAHVIGEIRTIKAGFTNYKYKVVSGDDKSSKANEAAELCRYWLSNYRPDKGMTWRDTFWNMGTAVLFGFRVHVLEWDIFQNRLLPKRVLDKPNRRFIFNTENDLRLLTKTHPYDGVETSDPYFVVTRHMPSHENPYGRALLSSCYWPYTFKHGGLKFFFQYCERFGLPWPIGRYPQGTPIEDQNALHEALLQLLDSGAATIPEGDAIELLEPKASSSGNQLAQAALVQLCNREISKALTSQTLATETQETGARAASETHKERQADVTQSDRGIVESGMDEIFTWITQFNFGDEVPPPAFEFYKPKRGTEEEAKVWQLAASISDKVPLRAFHERMGIPVAEEGEKTLRVTGNAALGTGESTQGAQFCRHCGHAHEFANGDEHLQETADTVDQAIEGDWIRPIADMLSTYEQAGKTLTDLRDDLPKLYGQLDDEQVTYILSQAMRLSFAEGMDAQE